ncbi:MAG: hypothetical protein NUV52_03960 [Candidatus Roizmanbacteria bacterium]|nr:hypothetical protein [Candidatus Roizmanbacteria bacterium]
MKKIIAQRIGEGLPGGFANGTTDIGVAIGKLISSLFSLIFIVGGLLVAYQLFMAALNWINSHGEKDKIEKAQKQITNAIIGLAILFATMALYVTIVGDIFGIIKRTEGGWTIVLPQLFN